MTFGGSHIDDIGVAQWLLSQLPCPKHIGPRRGLDVDLQVLCIPKRPVDLIISERMSGSIGFSPKSGHHLEREMTGRNNGLEGRNRCQRRPRDRPRHPESATVSITSDASTITVGWTADHPIRLPCHGSLSRSRPTRLRAPLRGLPEQTRADQLWHRAHRFDGDGEPGVPRWRADSSAMKHLPPGPQTGSTQRQPQAHQGSEWLTSLRTVTQVQGPPTAS